MSDAGEITAEEVTDDEVISEALNGELAGTTNRNILDLPVRIVVSVGTAQITIQQLLELTKDTVIDLESLIEDPVDIYVGDRLIARGELVEATDNENGIGVKLLEICGFGG